MYIAQDENGATLLSITVGHALEPLARVLGTFKCLSAVVANQRGGGVRLSDDARLPKDATDEIALAGVLESGILISLHYSARLPSGPAMVWDIQSTEGSLRVETQSGYLPFGDLAIMCRSGRAPVQTLMVPPAYFAPDLPLGGGAVEIARLYAQFAADLRTGPPKPPDFAIALAHHRVLGAITQAARPVAASMWRPRTLSFPRLITQAGLQQ